MLCNHVTRELEGKGHNTSHVLVSMTSDVISTLNDIFFGVYNTALQICYMYLFVPYMSVYLCVYLSVYPLVCLSVFLSIHFCFFPRLD